MTTTYIGCAILTYCQIRHKSQSLISDFRFISTGKSIISTISIANQQFNLYRPIGIKAPNPPLDYLSADDIRHTHSALWNLLS